MSGKPEITYDGRLDRCPTPLINTKLLLKKLQPEQRLILLLTDTGSKTDIPKWLATQGITFLSRQLSAQELELIIEKENTIR